jgi:hypothetical protein
LNIAFVLQHDDRDKLLVLLEKVLLSRIKLLGPTAEQDRTIFDGAQLEREKGYKIFISSGVNVEKVVGSDKNCSIDRL